MILITLIVFTAVIGYLAQVTGLCMVRGVVDWRKGRKLRLLAILSSGFWIYLYVPYVGYGEEILHAYNWHWSFLLGGFLFGLGAAVNGACSISTATRLARGEINMLFTMLGWLLGWLLLMQMNIDFQQAQLDTHSDVFTWFAVIYLFTVTGIVFFKGSRDWRIWRGIMFTGILAGAVFLLQPAWSPSYFVNDLGVAILHTDASELPSLDRIVILMTMLSGMAFGAWRYRRFKWVLPDTRGAARHISSGVLMGAGAAIALGGNDFQVLIALPAQSLAGLLATAGMVLGIWLGLVTINRLSNFAAKHAEPAH